MANIQFVHGNIFNTQMSYIVIPVNTVGVMGRGLAKQARDLYGEPLYTFYKDRCHWSYGGNNFIQIYDNGDGVELARTTRKFPHQKPAIIFFPTKKHWRDPSQLIWIRNGLNTLVERFTNEWSDIDSIAIPPLGCGLGQLLWEEVQPLIVETVEEMGVDAEIYLPEGL